MLCKHEVTGSIPVSSTISSEIRCLKLDVTQNNRGAELWTDLLSSPPGDSPSRKARATMFDN